MRSSEKTRYNYLSSITHCSGLATGFKFIWSDGVECGVKWSERYEKMTQTVCLPEGLHKIVISVLKNNSQLLGIEFFGQDKRSVKVGNVCVDLDEYHAHITQTLEADQRIVNASAKSFPNSKHLYRFLFEIACLEVEEDSTPSIVKIE